MEVDRWDNTRYKAHIGRGKSHIREAEMQDPSPTQEDNYTKSKHPLRLKPTGSLEFLDNMDQICDKYFDERYCVIDDRY